MLDINLIQQHIENGLISRRKHPECDLYILNYTPKCQINWHWDKVTIACRGLIVDGNWNIIQRPFAKFFTLDQWAGLRNHVHHLYGVQYQTMLDGPFTLTEKLDGSLGILYRNPVSQKWCVATRGSFTSDQAIRATEILQNKYPNIHPNTNWTYLVEIIYPENQIVVRYEHAQLVLLGVIDKDTGYDVPISRLRYEKTYKYVPDATNLYGQLPLAK